MKKQYEKILFCTDFSELADAAFEYACAMAQRHKTELHIFHAQTEPIIQEKLDQIYKLKYLESDSYKNNCADLKTECVTRQGMDYEEIIKYAKEADISIIVMATHGKGGFLKDMLAGSCARQVVGRSPVPILVIPPVGR